MGKRILLVQGHPDLSQRHLCHALEDAYAGGAQATGHEIRRLHIAVLDFPLLRSQQEWEHGALPPGLAAAQEDIHWAEHIVFFFPLWLGDMPALLKGFLEQVARPGFAFSGERNAFTHKGLTGRSARVVVTMGMPAVVYRWYFRAHSLRSLQRNILRFIGFRRVRTTVFGSIGSMSAMQSRGCLQEVRALGEKAG